MVSPFSLLLVQVGTPPDEVRKSHGDFPEWFSRAMGCELRNFKVVRAFEGEPLPQPTRDLVAVVTGSWAMVTARPAWSEATAQWIRETMAVGMPLFGVCYGHQLMAHALGGRVGYHPQGCELGCQPITLAPAADHDGLFDKVPREFAAHLFHEQTILELPPGARILASSAHDPHQIVRYGPNAISTQFHPEFTPQIAATCIQHAANRSPETGLNADNIVERLQETPVARQILTRFVQLARLART
ncbi:glutamine amidotransferase [Caballeronia sp. DA-9]|uniref:glutamine amidotransferase n=1 Tax=Caballeronia sp. DA-9 TaxID=3436237 RepID=UPI003F666E30